MLDQGSARGAAFVPEINYLVDVVSAVHMLARGDLWIVEYLQADVTLQLVLHFIQNVTHSAVGFGPFVRRHPSRYMCPRS